jgi:hypothetical protein
VIGVTKLVNPQRKGETMSLFSKLLTAQEMALCLVRKWWRPVTCIGIAGGMIVNGIVIPLVKWEVPDMTAMAAYVAAATAAFGVRAFEKYAGVVE